jgi:hypothetical protein
VSADAALHLLRLARAWWGRHCTRAGRLAAAKRLREQELRRAGVDRKTARLAAARMVDGKRGGDK